MNDGKERRAYARYDRQFNVRIARETKIPAHGEIPVEVATSVNISGSGILIRSREYFTDKECVRLMFLKPNSFEFFESAARVIRTERDRDSSFMVGLCFDDLTPSQMKDLDFALSLQA